MTMLDLTNPILEYPTWSIKDCDVVYRDGLYYLFFSAFYQDRGRIRSHVVMVRTADFRSYSEPLLHFDGREDGWEGMCSPDVCQIGDQYVMVFNSWGDKPGQPNQLFYRTSPDLETWGPVQPLAANLTAGVRAIDAALAHDDGTVYLAWKQRTDRDRTQIATADSLDVFTLLGEAQFSGAHDSMTQENYHFFQVDGVWHVLTTDYSPHTPTVYRRGHDWLTWVDGRALTVPIEDFNRNHHANAATLRSFGDGEHYLFYAGNNPPGDEYAGRGWNRLGVARV
jgi:hypothetical protein